MNLDAKSLNVQEMDLDEMKGHNGGVTLDGIITIFKLGVLIIDFFSGSFKLGTSIYDRFYPKHAAQIA